LEKLARGWKTVIARIILFVFALCWATSMVPTALASNDVDALLERGENLRRKGDYVPAQKSIEQAIRILQSNAQKEPARLSGAYNYLSLVENNAGKYGAAETDARKAIELAKEAGLGEDVIAMHSVVLANALRQEGKFIEAGNLLENALPVLDKPSTNQLLLGAAQNNLGAIYFWLGKYDKAMPMLNKGLETRRKAVDADHVDLANSYFDIGATEFKMGNTNEAIEHVAESARIRRLRLGEKHPETLASEATLAVMHESQGKTTEASMRLAKVVANARQSLGARHPDLAQYEDDYANVLAAQGKFQKARAIQADAMRIRKNVYG
jgi:tetratricopeptide (TPR) repeat protein